MESCTRRALLTARFLGAQEGQRPGAKVGFIPGSDINPVSAKLTQMFVPAPNAGPGSNLFEFNPTVTGKRINT